MGLFEKLFKKKDTQETQNQKNSELPKFTEKRKNSIEGEIEKKQKEKNSPTIGEKCDFCGKGVHEGEGVSVVGSQVGNVDDVFSAAQDAAEKMLTRKHVCSDCQAVLCLECGNLAGQKLGSGSTHCPGCGTKVL